MKKPLLAVLALILLCSAAFPKPKPQSGGDLQLMVQTTNAAFGGYSQARYNLGSSYQSPTRAPAGAVANLTVPASLGIGPLIPLNITNQESKDVSGGGKSIHYWGCSPTIPKGQPEIITGHHEGTGKTIMGGSAGFPDPMKMVGLTQTSPIPGDYAFKISYLGDVHVPLTEKQQFLGPLNLTEPANPQTVDTSAAINITWIPVANALGYSVMASGQNAKGETVYWENAKDANSAWYFDGVVGAVKAGKLHGPDHKTCTIPAGIFKGQVSLTVTGYSQEVKGTGALRAWGWAQTTFVTQLGQR